MSVPADLYYTQSHEWIRVEGDVATMGITHHAQDSLGDVVHFEAPPVGDAVEKGATFGEIESVKAVSDIYAPISGEVTEVNEGLDGNEETVNSDPYGGGWLVKMKLSDPSELDGLLKAEAYQALLAEG